jgi:hypothetical protein
MRGFLRDVCALIANSLSREPGMRFGGNSSKDELPPVLATSDWSLGLVESMADSGTAWYFDRR